MDKELADQFTKFTEELKNISKILKVANGLKINAKDPEFKSGGIQKDEKTRLENVASITANKLATKLGPLFTSSAQTIINGLKVSFDDIGIKLVDVKKSVDISNGSQAGYFDNLGIKLTEVNNTSKIAVGILSSLFNNLETKIVDTNDLLNSVGGIGDFFYDLLAKMDDVKDAIEANKNTGGIGTSFSIKGLSNTGIAKAIIKALGWQAFKDNIETWNASMNKKLFNIQNYMEELVGITKTPTDTKAKKKKEEGKGLTSILGGIAGLALLGAGIYMIVQALIESGKLNFEDTMKALLVVGAFAGLFLLLGLAGNRIKNAAIGFAIMSATILFLIIPTLNKLIQTNFDDILNGLGKFALIFGTCIGLMWLLSKIKKSDALINIAGLAALTLGLNYLILPALISLSNTDFDLILNGLGKFVLIIATCTGLMWLMSKIKKSDALVNIAGLAALTLGLNYLILPALIKLSDTNFDVILDGLTKFGLIVGACIGLMWLMGKIKKSNVIVSTLAIGALVYLVGYLAENLEKYADKPWDAISEGLKIAGIAFGSFVALFGVITGGVELVGKVGMAVAGAIMYELVYLVGYLADNLEKFAGKDWNSITEGLKIAGVAFGALVAAVTILGTAMAVGGPIAIVAGAVAGGIMLALAKMMDMAADSLIKFSGVNADNLTKVAKGMVAIGGGLVALMGGTAVGVAGSLLNGLTGLFNADPVSQLKKFEKLDATKLLNLGYGIKFLGEGLKMLSDTKNINLDNITKQMVNMITPLTQFSVALGGFKTAYEGLDNAIKGSEINKIYQMKLQNDNGIQKALVELNTKEVELLSSQLEQLRQNGEYLRIIANSGGSGGGMNVIGGNKSGGGIQSANFQTKESYLGHLKLTSAALQS